MGRTRPCGPLSESISGEQRHFGHQGCQHQAIDGFHLPSGQQRSIEHTPLAQALVLSAQTGAQAAGGAFLPRAKVSDDEPAIASVATAATSAIFETSFIM